MSRWLTLKIADNDSDVDIIDELICVHPDRYSENEGWIKWSVIGYSDKQIHSLILKIGKQLAKVDKHNKIKCEFLCD